MTMICYVVERQSQHQVFVSLRDRFWNKWKPEGQYCNWSAGHGKGWKDHTYRMVKTSYSRQHETEVRMAKMKPTTTQIL